MREYAHIRAPWYVVFDPALLIQDDLLVIYGLDKGEYRRSSDPTMPYGLKLRLWEGDYEGQHETWLRWADREGHLLLTGAESAGVAAEQARAAAENARVSDQKNQALAAKLRELGIDPDSLT